VTSDLALLSASQLARKIRRGAVRARDAVEACLARVDEWQPRLNVFLSLEAAAARRAADAADVAAKRGKFLGPLHGVPLAHKDMYYRKGKVATCGSKIRRDWKAPTTATALARLDAAGALNLGTLNMAEFAFGPTGHNWHFGHARNPWDRTPRITGGSSSGSGAGVAARMFHAALGSDTGGSIRLPAAFCGTVGIKPSWGRVSRAGAMPLSWSLDTVGPLTRTVEDAALILGLIAGADPADPTAADLPVPNYVRGLARGAKRIKIGVPRGGIFAEIDNTVADAMVDAGRVLQKLGAKIVEVTLPDMDAINAMCALVLSSEAATIHREWLRARPGDYSEQVRSRLEAGLMVPAAIYLDALRARGAALAEFNVKVFAKCDALLAPIIPAAAPTIAETDVGGGPELASRLGVFTRLARPFNYLGLPALAMPCGFSADGVPLSYQLVGPSFGEEVLFAIGHAYQQATEFHTRAPS
jgi:aspartyl-tRNA(Asn)/glutamyl-tRNA(Gln) amidotransferase subunit A